MLVPPWLPLQDVESIRAQAAATLLKAAEDGTLQKVLSTAQEVGSPWGVVAVPRSVLLTSHCRVVGGAYYGVYGCLGSLLEQCNLRA